MAKVRTKVSNSSEKIATTTKVNEQVTSQQQVNISAKETINSRASPSPISKVSEKIEKHIDTLHEKRLEKYTSNVEKANIKVRKTVYGKHVAQNKKGEFVEKVGFHKSDKKVKVGERNIRQQLIYSPFKSSMDHISSESRMSEQEFGQEANKKAHDVVSNIYRNDISKAIASSRIGFDRKRGNVARVNIKLHNEKAIGELRKNVKAIDSKLEDKALTQKERKVLNKEKKDLKKQHKKQKKKYALTAYKEQGIRKFSKGNVLKSGLSAFNPFQGTINSARKLVDNSKYVFNIFKGLWGIISFLFSFIISNLFLLLGFAGGIILLLIPIIAVSTFLWIFTGETNKYVQTTQITEVVQKRIDRVNKDWNDYVVNQTSRFPSNLARNYTEIKAINTPTIADFDNNKMINFLTAYFGETYSQSEVNALLRDYVEQWKIEEKEVERIQGGCKVFVSGQSSVCLQKEDDTIILKVEWKAPNMTEWINSKVSLLDSEKKELYLSRKELYDTGYGYAQIFDSPFGKTSEGKQVIQRMTSPFGCRQLRGEIDCTHTGVDLAGNVGDSLYSVGDNGIVTKAEFVSTGGGNLVEIQYETKEGTYVVAYAHLSEILVGKGQTVDKTTLIGKVGSTGNSTGPHLHIEIWKDKRWGGGTNINPVYIINLTNE